MTYGFRTTSFKTPVVSPVVTPVTTAGGKTVVHHNLLKATIAVAVTGSPLRCSTFLGLVDITD